MLGDCVVNKEIHVVGIQRSGQHAISSWLIGHFNHVFYKNCIGQNRDKNTVLKNGGLVPPWWYFDVKNKTDWEECHLDTINANVDAVIVGTEITLDNIELHPDLDCQKQKICDLSGKQHFSRDQKCALVIRHPLNHYASILKWHRNKRLRDVEKYCAVWSTFAQEFVGETNNINFTKVPIVYDQWFQDKSYRQKISNKFELDFTDIRLNKVMKIGINNKYGSSFDSMSHCNSAQKMNVLNRWEEFKDNVVFKKILQNEKLIYYCNKIGFDLLCQK